MKTLDFARSFVTFVTHGRGNNARIQVECRCRLTERNKVHHDYLLVASCKSEDTFAEDDLLYSENYDFCGIFRDYDTAAARERVKPGILKAGFEVRELAADARESAIAPVLQSELLFTDIDYTIVRTHSTSGPGGKETGLVRDRFEDVVIHLTEAEGRECTYDGEVVQASLQGHPLIGVTELSDPETGRGAVLDYPIKTMNANDTDNLWQVDTGPVAFPDLASPSERRIDWLDLAFVVFNRRDRAEFILQVPTPIGCESGGEVLVPHYSDIRKVQATSKILAL